MQSHVQRVVTYMSPVEAFATGIKIFDRQKVCLITWSAHLRPLIAWFFTGQRSNCSHVFLIFDFRSSEVPSIPWSALKKCFDRLILFWSRSQILHRTYKWLPLDMPLASSPSSRREPEDEVKSPPLCIQLIPGLISCTGMTGRWSLLYISCTSRSSFKRSFSFEKCCYDTSDPKCHVYDTL